MCSGGGLKGRLPYALVRGGVGVMVCAVTRTRSRGACDRVCMWLLCHGDWLTEAIDAEELPEARSRMRALRRSEEVELGVAVKRGRVLLLA